MEQLTLKAAGQSSRRIIASSGVFQIELLKQVGREDFPQLIEISRSLVHDYGKKAILTKTTIRKFFNKAGSLPFVARYRQEIIGYIIGVPLEEMGLEPWARLDENFGKFNTLYTYAFIIQSQFQGNGYAKMLKRVFFSWAKKRAELQFICGHVKLGISSKFSGEVKILNRVDNWQGTGHVFEYYRRRLHPDHLALGKNNPPLSYKS